MHRKQQKDYGKALGVSQGSMFSLEKAQFLIIKMVLFFSFPGPCPVPHQTGWTKEASKRWDKWCGSFLLPPPSLGQGCHPSISTPSPQPWWGPGSTWWGAKLPESLKSSESPFRIHAWVCYYIFSPAKTKKGSETAAPGVGNGCPRVFRGNLGSHEDTPRMPGVATSRARVRTDWLRWQWGWGGKRRTKKNH